jgi:hypothetical protein
MIPFNPIIAEPKATINPQLLPFPSPKSSSPRALVGISTPIWMGRSKPSLSANIRILYQFMMPFQSNNRKTKYHHLPADPTSSTTHLNPLAMTKNHRSHSFPPQATQQISVTPSAQSHRSHPQPPPQKKSTSTPSPHRIHPQQRFRST